MVPCRMQAYDVVQPSLTRGSSPNSLTCRGALGRDSRKHLLAPIQTVGNTGLLAPIHCDPRHITQSLSLIHISEPTRLLSISYAVFCLKKKKKKRVLLRSLILVSYRHI
eukprot:TRINITY_DN10600_c0_g1_i1.p1 TRINITY_DN10600_c0_g1~~TRINITY_DN10600_c0_g1_i1.p1  ORF type:complete len:109 (-),score=18.86 TRINITY_DN10600_c0_g1_i1:46-372(-)